MFMYFIKFKFYPVDFGTNYGKVVIHTIVYIYIYIQISKLQ